MPLESGTTPGSVALLFMIMTRTITTATTTTTATLVQIANQLVLPAADCAMPHASLRRRTADTRIHSLTPGYASRERSP